MTGGCEHKRPLKIEATVTMNGETHHEDLLGFALPPQPSEDLLGFGAVSTSDENATVAPVSTTMDLLGFDTEMSEVAPSPALLNGTSWHPPVEDSIDMLGTTTFLRKPAPGGLNAITSNPLTTTPIHEPLPIVTDHPILLENDPRSMRLELVPPPVLVPQRGDMETFLDVRPKNEPEVEGVTCDLVSTTWVEQIKPSDGNVEMPDVTTTSWQEPAEVPVDESPVLVACLEHSDVADSLISKAKHNDEVPQLGDLVTTEQLQPSEANGSINGNIKPLVGETELPDESQSGNEMQPDLEPKEAEKSVSHGHPLQENNTNLHHSRFSEPNQTAQDVQLHDVPISEPEQNTNETELDCEELSGPEFEETQLRHDDQSKPAEGNDFQQVPLSDPTLSIGEGMQSSETGTAEPAAVTDASPSWAAPAGFVVDQAPVWASAAASPALPRATKEILHLEPKASGVMLPPIRPAECASAINDEIITDPATEDLIADLQASIREYQVEKEIATERARKSDEIARKAEEQVQRMEVIVEAKLILEKELMVIKNSLHNAETDREHLLKELDKLREDRDEHERKQIVLSNRLNAAKKQEAVKANLAESLDDKVKVLQHDLEKTKTSLKEMTVAKEKLSEELTTSTNDYELRIKKLEASLSEERRLNEDRKKKMKAFVENKQEELREAKAQNDELNMELSQTNRSLREHHARWKQLHAQWVQSQTRNRELQRDINRMTKESENMSRMGDQMNVKLSQRAQETETHKNKRLTAKQELMTVLETLEAEREVSSKLQDSIKFTFTPKALSQQQILKESLRDFEHELVRLSHRLGKPLPPSHDTPAETFALHNDDEEGDSEGGTGGRRSRSQIDAAHLLSNLEDETQRVSQCIMVLTANIERLHVLIAQSGERSCATLFSDLLAGATAASQEEESSSMSGPRLGLGTKRSYGQVPTAHD